MATSELANPDHSESLAELVRAGRLPLPEERQRIRREARLSLRQMGDAIGVTSMTISFWERGTIEPRLHHAAAYGQLLNRLAEAISA
jgi:DNA-binding XRE family transcriptional regulator